ncbi:MAG TPA: hypothetical protein VIY53_19315 [Acidobacteriaceae bacterium]
MRNGKMAAVLGVAGILALPMLSRAQSAEDARPLASCGSPQVLFSVRHDPTSPPVAAPPGMALVVVVEKDFGILLPPTARVAADGKWQAAMHGESWISFAVDPGVHHLCTMTQPGNDVETALAHFTAVAGGVYFFEQRALAGTRGGVWTERTLRPLDSDEGAMLTLALPHSMARQKK